MNQKQRIKVLRRYLATKRLKAELEVLAVERQIDDLTHGHKRGLVWNETQAQRALTFFKHLRHWKGKWAGQPVELETFQSDLIIAPIFGWYREDGTRRITTSYVELPRKNGKSTLAAGLGLKMLLADDEQGAEIYAAATKFSQAMIVFNDAKQMRSQSPELMKRTTQAKWLLYHKSSSSSFIPLASEECNLDGLNSHCNIIDELHQHRTRGVWDKLITSHGSRMNPLDFVITTAGVGDDPNSIALERHDYAEKILRGHSEDDSTWAFIACADKEDDWTDPKIWAKANPNLGVSVYPRFLENQCTQAREILAHENTFRRYYLNQWTEQVTRWLDVKLWDECKTDLMPDLTGAPCFVGVDLADTNDINAMALVFPQGDTTYLKLYCWCPEATIRKRVREGKFAYDDWVKQGYIETTPGEVTNQNYILQRILEIAKRYEFVQLGIDSWQSLAIYSALDNYGFDVMQIPQTLQNFAGPTKEFERRLLGHEFRHDGNPVLRWMVGNVCVRPNENSDIRPDKAKSSEKIDGVVAMIMALGRSMSDEGSSIYETRGVIEI